MAFCKFDDCSHFDEAHQKTIAYLAQIVKSNVSGILLYLSKYTIYFSHFDDSIITGIIVKSCS